jgi:hypothetical protein
MTPSGPDTVPISRPVLVWREVGAVALGLARPRPLSELSTSSTDIVKTKTLLGIVISSGFC